MRAALALAACAFVALPHGARAHSVHETGAAVGAPAPVTLPVWLRFIAPAKSAQRMNIDRAAMKRIFESAGRLKEITQAMVDATTPPDPDPEPSLAPFPTPLALFGLGLAGLGVMRRRALR
jgi:MYXO-CTERM domain-containing protein